MKYPIDESDALVMAQSADEYSGSEMMIACLNELIKATVITVLSLAVTATLDENDFAVINGADAWKICFDRLFSSLPLTWRFHIGSKLMRSIRLTGALQPEACSIYEQWFPLSCSKS